MTDLFGCTCPHCGQDMPQQRDASFEQFWTLCPNKVSKVSAQKAWGKLSAAERQAATDRVRAFYDWFKRTYPQASPLHPSSYLNQKRWGDVVVQKQDKSGVVAYHRARVNSSIPAVAEAAKRALISMGVDQ